MLGAPYTDVRVETPDISVYDLRQMPGLLTIDLHPPASGPEVELVFGTAPGNDPADPAHIVSEVERVTRRSVLACRCRAGESRTWTADPRSLWVRMCDRLGLG